MTADLGGGLDKAEKFGGAMRQHIASFNATFPEFRLTVPTSLLHSLYEMDGGTRDLGGKMHLIFGADMMATLNPQGSAAPLFHHELFHVMHQAGFTCAPDAVWSKLWVEGLATYVSHALNPSADEKELLLDFPGGMAANTRAQLPAAWKQLEAVLDSTDEKTDLELFTMSAKDAVLPTRRGYYLGYLIAQEAGKTRDLAALADLDCKQARTLIGSTILKLAK